MAKARATALKPGKAVEWDASQGVVQGTVKRIVKKTTKVKGHVAKASADHPEVLVRSARTGAEAVHRPEELRAAETSPAKHAGGKTTSKRKRKG